VAASPSAKGKRGRKPGLFDEIHGKGALERLCSMLNDPALSYDSIARRFRISRQRVAQIAAQLGIDGRRRQRQRSLRTPSFQDNGRYPAEVRAVAHAVERLGLKTAAYRPSRLRDGKLAPTWKRTLRIEGVPCRVHFGRRVQKTPTGRKFFVFEISARTKKNAKVALFGFWRSRAIKLFVVPMRDLKKVSCVWLPYDGRYVDHTINRKRDWTIYENAWHLLKSKSPA
jgi:hypothetical protein